MNAKNKLIEYEAVFKCFYIFIIVLYTAALIIISMGDELLSDYDTALYWFNEIIDSVVVVQNIVICGLTAVILLCENEIKKQK